MLKRALSRIAGAVDRGDMFFLVGLLLLCYGISLVDFPAALIACGVVMMGYAYAPHAVKMICAIRGAGRARTK